MDFKPLNPWKIYPLKLVQVLEDFLEYWKTWEKDIGVKRDKRLTASAAYGLRVTLTTALELSTYLINDCGYEYFMTRRLNQDALEVKSIAFLLCKNYLK